MSNHGKKYLQARKGVETVQYSFSEGIKKVKELSFAKFDESVDVDINVGIDPTKGDQALRGAVTLPHGIGRTVKIAVFAKGEYADQATKAGADYVGAEDLIEKIEGGWLDFNFAVATPDLMGLVGKVAKILGPRGLVPSKKNGTVTFDVAKVVSDLKKGRLFFKNDKSAIVHFTIGKVSFDNQNLLENLKTFFKALVAAKPASAKGKFIKKITLSSTMGVGIRLNPDELS
ncbi:50S ribosomal protein L1 [Candidatus Babela massiliensis]|uniref:Large ribosomal subunit protein uL1 n=1 Tax=Candidatus Babela massiliensis TaxID=673862 RepID=V6DHY5_9BACT|nr:50S ribosomal protein L1 [Candidatus Babela massiliensis]CDK30543.1 ribosomal protein L1 [Candidatus Babela massiliensis]